MTTLGNPGAPKPPLPPTAGRWKSLLRIIVTSYIGLTFLLAVMQRSYIYYPHRMSPEAAGREANALRLQPWLDAAGDLIGWRRPSASPEARRVLIFHGNAGSAVNRHYYADVFAARPGGADWSVFILEYPGYGPRPGRPTERALTEAARTALDVLLAESPSPVLVLGESLGSGVACALAAERPAQVAGLLLITPFSSLADVAAIHYPFLPIGLFLRDRYDSPRALRRYRGPLVVVTAGDDEVIPARLGRALWQDYKGPRRLVEQAGRTHNTLDLDPGAPWWNEAVGFLLTAAGSEGTPTFPGHDTGKGGAAAAAGTQTEANPP